MTPTRSSSFLRRVRDLVRRAPVTCRPGTRAVDVARLLTQERVGSVIVIGDDGVPVGVVTDRDLREKIVAAGRDPATAVSVIMSAPVIGVRPAAFAFEAVLEMTRRDIRHLAVMEDGRLIGVVSARDLLAEATAHPVLLARDILRASSLDALAGFAEGITSLVRSLVEAGTTAYDLGQLVAELNDRLVARTLALVGAAIEEAHGPPPVPFCWLAFGSEARREQTLRTDQDNGLVYADPPPALAATATAYFGRFADAAIEGLVRVGFPRCPGNIMASNPQWCQPLATWRSYFRRWMDEPLPERLLGAAIHFDVRPVAGALELGTALAELVRSEAPAHRLFLALLARDVLDRPVPLTLLGRVAVARRGPRAGTVDVKAGGTMQLVGAGRVLALELGLAERNTLDRLRAAAAAGVWDDRDARHIVEAGQTVMRLRLVHQLQQLARRQEPDNRLVLADLSRTELLLLRDALKVIADVQETVRGRYPHGIG